MVNPAALVIETARAKSAYGCNLLAAEVVAVAAANGAEVRLTPGNARGVVANTVRAAGIQAAVWATVRRGDRLVVEEQPLP